jgi:hypothetical protein
MEPNEENVPTQQTDEYDSSEDPKYDHHYQSVKLIDEDVLKTLYEEVSNDFLILASLDNALGLAPPYAFRHPENRKDYLATQKYVSRMVKLFKDPNLVVSLSIEWLLLYNEIDLLRRQTNQLFQDVDSSYSFSRK